MVSFNGVNGSSNVHGPQEPSKEQVQISEPIAQRMANPSAQVYTLSNPAAAMAKIAMTSQSEIGAPHSQGMKNLRDAVVKHGVYEYLGKGSGNKDLKAVMSNVFYGTAI